MNRPILYLLAPGFMGRIQEHGHREYCPECAEMWGLLSYFPAIKEALDIRYMPIDRPRVEMVEMLGEDNQNCPTLVLRRDAQTEGLDGLNIQSTNGHDFIDNARDIGMYFARIYGTPLPRGHY